MLEKFLQQNRGNEALNASQQAEAVQSKTIQTVRLLGSQVLELKSTVEEQSKIIKTLIHEMRILKESMHEVKGDFDMMTIDQKDIAKQVRSIKEAGNEFKQAEPSLEDIFDEAYPKHKESPLLKEALKLENTVYERQQESPQSLEKHMQELAPREMPNNQKQNPQKTSSGNLQKAKTQEEKAKNAEAFVFERLPKLLKLD